MKEFKVRLVKSSIGATQVQKDTLRCLGLRKIGDEVVIKDNPAQRGQMFRMQQWLKIETKSN